MTNDLKNIARKAVLDIGNRIVNMYPDSFIVTNLNTGAAGACLGQKIYDRIHYVKHDQNDTGTSQLISLEDLEEPTKKPKTQDEYRCVSYMPDLPENVTWESLEEKRLQLIEKYEASTPIQEIIPFMVETYCLQRKHINMQNRDLSTFFINWPYFPHYKTIIAHADHLLGKGCLKTWQDSLKGLYVPINCFSWNKEIFAIEKFKKKNKGKGVTDDMKYVQRELIKAKDYCNTLVNQVPYQNILFDIISKYMGAKEKLELLYLIIKEDASDEELLELVEALNPVLVVEEKDIHDSASQYNVVIEKKICFSVKSFLDGILLTFVSYFIFGLVYPPEIEGTLEVIQRLFLKSSPPRGTKRNGKRKAVVQHPKYTSFIKEIDSFRSHETSDL